MPVVQPKVALSTASVWPESVERTFELAAGLGYDGVEIMVWTDPASRRVPTLRGFAERYGVPILAMHAPCLLITQRVWGSDPVVRLHRSAEVAAELGVPTVVVHPPFRWQRRYAAGFAEVVADVADRTGVVVAVENMFPVRRGGFNVSGFHPTPDPTDVGHRHYTLDVSHTAAAGQDALTMMGKMGAGLAHVHLADGTGVPRDEHLVPGRGTQPCAEVCRTLVADGYPGTVVVEINTRKARSQAERLTAVRESLTFTRKHLQ